MLQHNNAKFNNKTLRTICKLQMSPAKDDFLRATLSYLQKLRGDFNRNIFIWNKHLCLGVSCWVKKRGGGHRECSGRKGLANSTNAAIKDLEIIQLSKEAERGSVEGAVSGYRKTETKKNRKRT